MSIQLKEYLPEQIKLEEEYHKKLQEIIFVLVILLMDYVESGNNVSLIGLLTIYQNWLKQNSLQLESINKTIAIKMTQLAYNSLTGDTVKIPVEILKIKYIKKTATELDLKLDGSLGAIVSRFVDLIPVGTSSINYSLINDESTKAELIRRSNVSLDRYVQSSITQGTFNAIAQEMVSMGINEYLADNQHDDRVRATHRKYFDGKTWYSFNNPPPCGNVGTEFGCRCYIVEVR